MELSTHHRQQLPGQPRLLLLLAALAVGGVIIGLETASWPLMRNTLALGLGSALIATPIGAILSYLLMRGAVWGGNWIFGALVVLLFMPLQLQLAGWDALFGKLGWQTLAYGSPAQPFLHGMRGAIWVHAMAAIPWTTLLGCLGWIASEPQWEEAAMLELPVSQVFWRITLPQAAPVLLTAALWVCIQSTGEMTVTNIYVVRTYAEEFYNELAADGSGGRFTAALAPGVLGTIAFLSAGLFVLSQISAAAPMHGRRLSVSRFSNRQRNVASWLVWSILLALVAIPLASLLVRAGMIVQETSSGPERVWSLSAMIRVILSTPGLFEDEFRWTFLISATTATLATLCSLYPAWRVRSRSSAVIWGPLIAGFGLPGPVIGLAVIWLLNRPVPGFQYLYDYTIAAPVLTMLVRTAPLALLLLTFGFATLGQHRLEAAALDGAGPLARFWRIAIVERLLVIAAAWLIAFAQAAGDLSTSILVLPPGMTTLQFRLFEKVHSGVEEQVAGIAIVSAAIYAAIMLLAIALYRWMVNRPYFAEKAI